MSVCFVDMHPPRLLVVWKVSMLRYTLLVYKHVNKTTCLFQCWTRLWSLRFLLYSDTTDPTNIPPNILAWPSIVVHQGLNKILLQRQTAEAGCLCQHHRRVSTCWKLFAGTQLDIPWPSNAYLYQYIINLYWYIYIRNGPWILCWYIILYYINI